MLKPIAFEGVKQAPMPVEAVNNVFKVMHGFYGNLFLSKFATGSVDASGQDQGVVSARQIWAHGLRDMDAATVKAALAQCVDRHPEYPPSLPQFMALCRANQPRKVFDTKALGMSGALSGQYAKKARDSALKAVRKTKGLDLLKLAIADAVGAAGGDEAAELARLDRMFA